MTNGSIQNSVCIRTGHLCRSVELYMPTDMKADLEALQEERASSHVDGEISWFVSSCGGRLGVPLQVPWGTQGASRVVSAKSSLH